MGGDLNRLLRGGFLGFLVMFFTFPGQAHAHGFGERYDLPLPLWLYLFGAGVAVLCSFVLIGALIRKAPSSGAYPRWNLLNSPIGKIILHPFLLTAIKLVSVSIFVLVVMAGLFGDSTPTNNFSPTLIWIIWWVGVAYVCALIGNVWRLINPWKIIFDWIESIGCRFGLHLGLNFPINYPLNWGYWPAIVLFFSFSWVELVYDYPAAPLRLAQFTLMYSAITWAGMIVFGKSVWLQYGEVFSVVFRLLARFSPTESRVRDAEICNVCSLPCLDQGGQCLECDSCLERVAVQNRQLNVRPYGVGLLQGVPVSGSMMGVIILLLATVTFDGFTATSVWKNTYLFWHARVPMSNLLETVGLVSFPVVFGSIFFLICWLTSIAASRSLSPDRLARHYVASLIPIALAYHLAHYLNFLLIQGQLIIPLASDPFGFGWDLFGSADYKLNISYIGARFAWYMSVLAIVLGHIVAVYLAHVAVLGIKKPYPETFKTQIPMLMLMISYTILSLWILSQPIVETTI